MREEMCKGRDMWGTSHARQGIRVLKVTYPWFSKEEMTADFVKNQWRCRWRNEGVERGESVLH